MGMYDTVLVPCPVCGKKEEFQSKSGRCSLQVVELSKCPGEILMDVNRHAPYTCEKCGTLFEVDLDTLKSFDVVKTINEVQESVSMISEKELEELAELLMQSENLQASVEMLKEFETKCWQKGTNEEQNDASKDIRDNYIPKKEDYF